MVKQEKKSLFVTVITWIFVFETKNYLYIDMFFIGDGTVEMALDISTDVEPGRTWFNLYSDRIILSS